MLAKTAAVLNPLNYRGVVLVAHLRFVNGQFDGTGDQHSVIQIVLYCHPLGLYRIIYRPLLALDANAATPGQNTRRPGFAGDLVTISVPFELDLSKRFQGAAYVCEQLLL